MELSQNARAFMIDSLIDQQQDEDEALEQPESPLNLSAKAGTVVPADPMEPSLPNIKCDLARPELWHQFAEIGTEMIITKAGRRMFPTVQVQFNGEGINAASNYLVVFEVIPASGKRFRYSYLNSGWTALDPNSGGSSKTKPGNFYAKRASATDFGKEMAGNKLYVHPESPLSGEVLLGKLLSFERIKLTNNEALGQYNDHMVLKSMHQYEPRIHLIELSGPGSEAGTGEQGGLFGAGRMMPAANTVWTFDFPEARFMAVTAYQNQLITKLKIDNNPFAKGFRKVSRFSVAQVHLAIGTALTTAASAVTLISNAVPTTAIGGGSSLPLEPSLPLGKIMGGRGLKRLNNRKSSD